MADDCLIGFEFFDLEDKKASDLAVDLVSEKLFSEVAVDAAYDHLGARAEHGEDASSMIGIGELNQAEFVESFDFII